MFVIKEMRGTDTLPKIEYAELAGRLGARAIDTLNSQS